MTQHSEHNKEWTQISQFDISSRQLITGQNSRQAGDYTDIGEAEVVSTLFGNAKVRIIRKQKNSSRPWWVLVILVFASGIGVAVWLEFFQPPTEPLQDMALPASKNATEQTNQQILQTQSAPSSIGSDAVLSQRIIQPANTDMSLKVIKPRTPQTDTNVNQAKINGTVILPAKKQLVEIKPASNVNATSAVPIMKKSLSGSSVVETMPPNNNKLMAPAGNDTLPVPINPQQ